MSLIFGLKMLNYIFVATKLTNQVYNLNNNTVSWLREADRHILTVGKETFISDRRFVALHTRNEMNIIGRW